MGSDIERVHKFVSLKGLTMILSSSFVAREVVVEDGGEAGVDGHVVFLRELEATRGAGVDFGLERSLKTGLEERTAEGISTHNGSARQT